DAALARRFQLVSLDEPSEEDAITILRGLRPKYEAAHQVRILDEAIVAAARKSSRYISGRQLPDKAGHPLDTTAARTKIGLTSRPDVIEDAEREVQILESEREALEQDKTAGAAIDVARLCELAQQILERKEQCGLIEQQWQAERAAAQEVFA